MVTASALAGYTEFRWGKLPRTGRDHGSISGYLACEPLLPAGGTASAGQSCRGRERRYLGGVSSGSGVAARLDPGDGVSGGWTVVMVPSPHMIMT